METWGGAPPCPGSIPPLEDVLFPVVRKKVGTQFFGSPISLATFHLGYLIGGVLETHALGTKQVPTQVGQNGSFGRLFWAHWIPTFLENILSLVAHASPIGFLTLSLW